MNDTPPSAPSAGAPAAARGIHPLVATAAIAVTAVSAIAAYQFLAPKDAQSAIDNQPPASQVKTTPHPVAPASSSSWSAAPARTPPSNPSYAPPQESSYSPPPAAAAPVCTDCGEVIGIRTSRQAGEGTGIGAVAGGVVGGVLGHQVGGGRGKEAMTVLGAIGGLVAGNEAEKQVKAQTLYLVDVRMADGSARTVTLSQPPQVGVGTPVHVAGNTILPR